MKEKKMSLTIRVNFNFRLFAEDDKSFTSLEFLEITKSLREAIEAMMDSADTVHDYVGEVLPDGVDLSSCEVGSAILSGIGGKNEE